MKKKDFDELKSKDTKALQEQVLNLKKEETGLRLELRMSKAKNVHSLREKRKDVARAMTILAQKRFTAKETKDATG